MSDLLNAARYYKLLGFSVVAVKQNKRSIGYWRNYQRKIAHDFALERDFSNPTSWGIAIVCGKVSGNLEVIDLDGKYDDQLFEQFRNKLIDYSYDLYAQLVIASTKNNGYHFLYRCTEVSSHLVLARRPCSEEEILRNPKDKAKTLIEKLGESTYAVVYPSPGYQFIQGSIEEIPVITPEQRNRLLRIAQSFNQLTLVNKTQHNYSAQDIPELSPFYDYDTRGDFIALLERHGWEMVRTLGMRTYFRRPGNTDHDTSGDYHHGLGLFSVFTPNSEFNRLDGYRPHALYAILECNGDFKLAAKRLLQEGYGVAYNQRY